jgi:exoribonuclease II
MELARRVARVDERDVADGFYVGKTEDERSLERTWRRWENNFKKDLHEIERLGVRWIDVAQDKEKCQAFIDTVMNLQVPQSAGNFLAN